MAEVSPGARKFNDEEVALIIKRAAELQQTEQVAEEPGHAMTLAEVEQIAQEAGIDPRLIRRAAQGLDRPSDANRPSPWAGAPTRLVFDRVIDGEIPIDAFEPLVNEIRRTFGDNGVPSILGRTLAWTSTSSGGRRNARGRQIDVSVTSRGGVTTIRVEEEMGNLAGALFGGLVGGGGGGTTGITIGIGMGVFQSLPVAATLWVAVAGGFYMLARAIFARTTAKREKQIRVLIDRLEEQVETAVASAPRVGAGAALSPGAGEETPGVSRPGTTYGES
jgi:hypothetical protein